MTNLNSIKKKISKEDLKVSGNDPSKLLVEFFNGLIIQIDKEYNHES